MRILVLGGGAFVGRAIVTHAISSGAEVTTFSRGRTGTGLFPQARRLVGDRDTGDYGALAGETWDAVVDVSGYVPRHVNQAMDALGDRAGRYLFVSSQAVYTRDDVGPGSDEDTALRAPVRDTEELTDATYGPLKVACEQDVRSRFGDRATIVRPGKVAGPNDPQPGLTYWVRRAARGGVVALPGHPDQPIQVVDSRALATLVVRLLADDRPGAFHAVGPAEPETMASLIQTCARVAGTGVRIVPVPARESFPLIRRPGQWSSQRRSPARAYAAGMPAVPLEITVADVLAWDRGRGEPPLDGGFTAAEEARALAEAAR